MASLILWTFPFVAKYFGGNNVLWRSTILHPLVERKKIGSVLEMLEHSSSQLATASRVFSSIRNWHR